MDKNFTSYQEQTEAFSFQDLKIITSQLRDKAHGCPWDLKQDFRSLKQFLLNEMREILDAVDNNDPENLCEEIGDVLFLLFLYGQIASEQGQFDIDQAIDTVCRKMIRRHPHVFAGVTVESEEEQKELWYAIKRAEKAEKQGETATKP